ncbi:MAG: iron-sulfur cluster insertion protein ErpA, partial [Methylophilales bacterium 16-45-7]
LMNTVAELSAENLADIEIPAPLVFTDNAAKKVTKLTAESIR